MIESTMKCTKTEWKKSKRWKNKAKEQPTSWDSQKECAQFSKREGEGNHVTSLLTSTTHCRRMQLHKGHKATWQKWAWRGMGAMSECVCVCVYVRVWLWHQSQTQLFELRRWQRRQCEGKTERERERKATASRTKSVGKIFCHVINAKATVAIAVAVSMLMTLHLSVRRVRVEIVVVAVVIVIVIVIVNGTDASKCGYNNLCTCNDRQQSVKEQLPVVWTRILNLNPKPETRYPNQIPNPNPNLNSRFAVSCDASEAQ